MGQDLKGRELGVGIAQRKDGRYTAHCIVPYSLFFVHKEPGSYISSSLSMKASKAFLFIKRFLPTNKTNGQRGSSVSSLSLFYPIPLKAFASLIDNNNFSDILTSCFSFVFSPIESPRNKSSFNICSLFPA